MRDVTRGGARRPAIRVIAKKWGFEDVSYFHRLFKQKYQVTPGDAARSIQQEGTQQSGLGLTDEHARNISAVHKWFGVRASE